LPHVLVLPLLRELQFQLRLALNRDSRIRLPSPTRLKIRSAP
jgi:hypothetical protein